MLFLLQNPIFPKNTVQICLADFPCQIMSLDSRLHPFKENVKVEPVASIIIFPQPHKVTLQPLQQIIPRFYGLVNKHLPTPAFTFRILPYIHIFHKLKMQKELTFSRPDGILLIKERRFCTT